MENKGADHLHSNCAGNQRHCFHYIDSISLFFLNQKPLHYPSSVAVQPSLCRAWSETRKTGFLMINLAHSLTVISSISSSLFQNYKADHKKLLVCCAPTYPPKTGLTQKILLPFQRFFFFSFLLKFFQQTVPLNHKKLYFY